MTARNLPNYLLNIYLSPIGSNPFLVTMSFVEHGAWPVPTLADVLRDGWLRVQKLFRRIQECQKTSRNQSL
jgi:hypothetical protein